MIKVVFTLDYEIYGDGMGSLRELVYDPCRRLMDLFLRRGCRFVTFVEAAELEMISAQASDPAIGMVEQQVRDLRAGGFEIGLHLHPQWYNATLHEGTWILDYEEYNLCTLPRTRIEQIVNRSVQYLRNVLDEPRFTPLSFRAGNWLFQPSAVAAQVLAEAGIRVDSSVFKGGCQRVHHLDYRSTLKLGDYWRFEDDVTTPSPAGRWLEIPIHSTMVPCWRMLTAKRVAAQARKVSAGYSRLHPGLRLLDYLRPRYPLKLDFCRMTLGELIRVVETLLQEDAKHPENFRPVVTIGHTKDLVDMDTIESFLSFLNSRGVGVSGFAGLLDDVEVPATR
jgi:hypothetical protein